MFLLAKLLCSNRHSFVWIVQGIPLPWNGRGGFKVDDLVKRSRILGVPCVESQVSPNLANLGRILHGFSDFYGPSLRVGKTLIPRQKFKCHRQSFMELGTRKTGQELSLSKIRNDRALFNAKKLKLAFLNRLLQWCKGTSKGSVLGRYSVLNSLQVITNLENWGRSWMKVPFDYHHIERMQDASHELVFWRKSGKKSAWQANGGAKIEKRHRRVTTRGKSQEMTSDTSSTPYSVHATNML